MRMSKRKGRDDSGEEEEVMIVQGKEKDASFLVLNFYAFSLCLFYLMLFVVFSCVIDVLQNK